MSLTAKFTITRLLNTVRNHLGQSQLLLSNTRWMLVSEGLARASRLATVIVLAAYLSSVDYGIAMLAIVCHELLRVLTRTGSAAKVIQCSDKELNNYAGNAITLNWCISLGIGFLQFFLAPAIANFYQSPSLQPMLQLMAITYCIYPLVTVRVFLLQRCNQMKYFGLCSALAVITDNLSTALLASLGYGVYSVAIAKILAAVVWVAAFITCKVPAIRACFSLKTITELLSFSCKVLCSELLRSLRSQVDVLLAGKLLAPELFGLYSFAKSAGVGMGQALSNAYLTCIYPRLAELQRQQSLHQGIYQVYMISFAISVIFLAQAFMAPVYVPLLFKQFQGQAAGLVMILCLSAIPALMLDISALTLRVQNQLKQEIKLQSSAVLCMVLFIMLSPPENPQAFALRVVCISTSWLLLPLFFNNTNPLFPLRRIIRCQ